MTRGRYGGGSHGHGAGFKPPWWPANEPFPPADPEAWRGRRRHFARRIGLMVVFLFVLLFLVQTLVNLALPIALDKGPWNVTRTFAVLLGLTILSLFFVFVLRTVRRMARPIGEVMEAADRVAAGDYDVRVGEHGWRETRRLAHSFNAMTERLGSNDEQRRNLLADLAHELRTPLSVIQGNVEGMLDGLYPADRDRLEPILEETKVMARLLEDLGTLSTAEAGALQLHREPTEPAELVEDVAAAFRSEAETAGVTLQQQVASGLSALDIDPVRIGQVLSNLVANAVRHTPSGGSVVVSADLDEESVAFTVRDSGPGIAPDVRPHVFERFYKTADSGGAGLGLAIAKSLVEAHGGEISVADDRGPGTVIRFTIPLGPRGGAT